MKAVVIGETSGATMEQVMAVYPRHKAVVDELVARGEVIGIKHRGNKHQAPAPSTQHQAPSTGTQHQAPATGTKHLAPSTPAMEKSL